MSEFDYGTHLRRVCYYTISLVILLAGVTVIAWSERNEANFAAARASSLWAFYNARSMQDLRMRLEMRKTPGASAVMPNAKASPASDGPGAAPSGAPAAAASGAPSANASGAPAGTREQRHDLALLDRDRENARDLALRYEADAENEKGDAIRFAMAQMGLMIAIMLAALGGPTKQVRWCYAGLALAAACVGVAGYSYLT